MANPLVKYTSHFDIHLENDRMADGSENSPVQTNRIESSELKQILKNTDGNIVIKQENSIIALLEHSAQSCVST